MFTDALALVLEILTHTPHTALKARPALRQDQAPPPHNDSVAFAFAFYGIKPRGESPASSQSTTPFVAAFENVISLSTAAAKSFLAENRKINCAARDVLQSSLRLLDGLLGQLDEETDAAFVAQWDPAGWLSTLLQCLQQRVGHEMLHLTSGLTDTIGRDLHDR